MARPRSRLGAEAKPTPVLVRHGWSLWFHPCLIEQLERLAAAADREKQRPGPNGKLLAHLWALITDHVPANPAHPRYRIGNTLGPAFRHWFRAKTGAGRYRLFYRFDSAAKVVVFAWVNDADTLRTYGSRSDAYAVFKARLAQGNPPDDWGALLAQSKMHPALRIIGIGATGPGHADRDVARDHDRVLAEAEIASWRRKAGRRRGSH